MALSIRRPIGITHPPYVVAAFDCSRLAAIEGVLDSVDAVADARCDAIKLSALPWASCTRIFDHAERRGLTVLATVSDERAVERLDWMGAAAFEIFFDWADLDLVACAARTGKPVILSIANASELDIAQAVAIVRDQGNGVALVQRTLDASVAKLDHLTHHDTVIGVSDRLSGPSVVRSAIRRGASIIEKRLAPRNAPDLVAAVRDCELAWALLGNVDERHAVN